MIFLRVFYPVFRCFRSPRCPLGAPKSSSGAGASNGRFGSWTSISASKLSLDLLQFLCWRRISSPRADRWTCQALLCGQYFQQRSFYHFVSDLALFYTFPHSRCRRRFEDTWIFIFTQNSHIYGDLYPCVCFHWQLFVIWKLTLGCDEDPEIFLFCWCLILDDVLVLCVSLRENGRSCGVRCLWRPLLICNRSIWNSEAAGLGSGSMGLIPCGPAGSWGLCVHGAAESSWGWPWGRRLRWWRGSSASRSVSRSSANSRGPDTCTRRIPGSWLAPRATPICYLCNLWTGQRTGPSGRGATIPASSWCSISYQLCKLFCVRSY